jgi:hypothetical protein
MGSHVHRMEKGKDPCEALLGECPGKWRLVGGRRHVDGTQ